MRRRKPALRHIRNETREQECPEPAFKVNGFFTATFRPNPEVRASADVRSVHGVTMEDTMEVTTEDDMEVTMEVTKATRQL